MAVSGRRDLSMAPSPRAGFEMSLLRMLAFRPGSGAAGKGDDASRPGARAAGTTVGGASTPTPARTSPSSPPGVAEVAPARQTAPGDHAARNAAGPVPA